MVDEELLRSYAYLWDGSDPGWVVQFVSEADAHGLPLHRERHQTLIIDDDDEYRGVMAAMRAHGCPVVPQEALRSGEE